MLVTIDKILQTQGKTTFWLSREIGCDFQSLQRLINNQTSKISFSTMESICKALRCSPSDIFMIEE